MEIIKEVMALVKLGVMAYSFYYALPWVTHAVFAPLKDVLVGLPLGSLIMLPFFGIVFFSVAFGPSWAIERLEEWALPRIEERYYLYDRSPRAPRAPHASHSPVPAAPPSQEPVPADPP